MLVLGSCLLQDHIQFEVVCILSIAILKLFERICFRLVSIILSLPKVRLCFGVLSLADIWRVQKYKSPPGAGVELSAPPLIN